jgi:hypothetical protein
MTQLEVLNFIAFLLGAQTKDRQLESRVNRGEIAWLKDDFAHFQALSCPRNSLKLHSELHS